MEDGEHAAVEVEILNPDPANPKVEEQARNDVESRVHEIANDVIDEREWASDEHEEYEEDLDEELSDRRGDKDDDY